MAQVTLRDYLQETEDVISNGHVDDALNRCQYVLARFPESLEAQRLLGEVYLAQGHFDEAQQTFDWVLTNDPENIIVYCDRALISERRSDYDTALDCYQQAYELSRGNNKIRNEFNKLSAKVGQQGFMFSRAGLARLYMRGDLLTQAIQEWEAVLAVTPDRLDARTGLLEAYWRDGLYDRVEQLATQILQDVPGCEKALLLLAYVVSAKDIEQARELLRRAEALDPDLVMAQDLFSDLIASQPNEPFLALLKKTPVDLEKVQGKEDISTINTALSPQEELFTSSGTSASAGSLSDWSSLEGWNGENTLLKVPPEAPSSPSSSNLPVWSNDSFAALSDASNVLNQGQNGGVGAQPEQEQTNLSAYLNAMSSSGSSWEMPAPPVQQPSMGEKLQSEPWALLQESLNERKEPNAQGQSQPEPSLNGFEWGSSEKDLNTADFASSWSSSSKEENLSPPPDWLSMLTQGDREQMSGHMPAISLSQPVVPTTQPSQDQSLIGQQMPVNQEPVAQQPASPSSITQEPVSSASAGAEPASALFAAGSADDEEESFFGPAWLKALGAASMDEEESSQVVVNEAPVETTPPVVQEVQSSAETHESWTVSAPEVTPSSAQEQNLDVHWTQPAAQESQTTSMDSAWKPLSGPVPQPSAPSPEYSWSRSLAGEESMPYEIEQIQEEADPPLPSAIEAASTWENPGEAAWRTPSSDTDTPFTFDAMSSMPSAEATVPAAAPPGEEEQNILVTLEELENNLRSNGFVPMEPNWLSTLAQEQNISPLSSEEPSLPTWAQGQETYAEPPLSSALAELGNLSQQSSSTSPTIDPEPLQDQSLQAPPSSATPLWAASLQSTPSAPAPVPQKQEVLSVQEDFLDDGDAPTSHVAAIKRPVGPASQANPLASGMAPSQVEAKKPVEPIKKAEPVKKSVEPIPVARKDAFMDMELETTMKRPAIRLQPMQQQRPATAREQTSHASHSSKNRSVERAATGKVAEVNYQERLLQGYQYQLVGDYDEAMQEYRTVIRYAPELLGEVISNVRALLKLAPKYSAGYRVLGDAYMRQGEYLQAMEAYNKALTMAKKAKA